MMDSSEKTYLDMFHKLVNDLVSFLFRILVRFVVVPQFRFVTTYIFIPQVEDVVQSAFA